MSSFLDLPPELRNTIFKEASTQPEPDSLGTRETKTSDQVQYLLIPERTFHALTQVSKQVRSEAIPMFYASNTFAISISTGKQLYPSKRLIRADKYVATWALAASEQAIGSIRGLRLSFDSLSKYGLQADYFEQSSEVSDWFQHITTPCESSEGSSLKINLIDGTIGDLDMEHNATRSTCCKVCKRHVQEWLDSIAIVGDKKLLTKERLLQLVW